MLRNTPLHLMIAVAAGMLLSLTTPPAYSEESKEGVIAIVNGKPLGKNAFDVYVRMRTSHKRSKSHLSADQRRALLDEFINRELIYQDALDKGLDKLPVVKEEIENQRRSILASYNIRQLISKPPTMEAMKKAYDKHMAKAAVEYNARHILVKTEEEARNIIKLLDQGADFGQLAKQKSIDASAKNGGDLDWFSADQMVPPFRDAISRISVGSHTKTPVHTRFGWHVIQLENKRTVPPPQFDDVKDKLRILIQNETIARHINALRNKGRVEIK